MIKASHARNLFLRFMCLIYLFAFLSFYVQIPGLYGNNGILPARNYLAGTSGKTLTEKIHNRPTLLWAAPYLGLNTEYMMDVLALIGAFLSFSGFVSSAFCSAPVFGALWSLYFSLYQVGQTFMYFQWDILLLEAGFLAILNAPLSPSSAGSNAQIPGSQVTFSLVKWLLFRLMYTSGVVKLQSGCPTWWDLTALSYHFESQPLPTPLAWYAHQLPLWLLKLGTVFTHVVEQLMPFLFFFPLRSVRIVGFFFQIALQIGIILTGNYNFFNLLTMVLCLSLLDNQFFFGGKEESGYVSKVFRALLNVAVHGFVAYIAVVYYSLRLNPNGTVDSSIAFTKSEFNVFLASSITASIYVAGLSLIFSAIEALQRCASRNQSVIRSTAVTFFSIILAFYMFTLTLVPHMGIHSMTNTTISPSLRYSYSRISNLHLVNSYGLFRRMTGVGGRPEVVIEGANDIQGPWLEYNFKYKPTNVNSSLSFVLPYQPRLDWQMWFAALGTYNQNPWLMSVAYRLLTGEKSVMNLIDESSLPFQTPPKYMKASLYHYHYTPWSQRRGQTWWKREKVGEYFPIFTSTHAPLVEYLTSLKILDDRESALEDEKRVLPVLKRVLDFARDCALAVNPPVLLWSVFFAACALVATRAASPRPTTTAAAATKKNVKKYGKQNKMGK